MAVAARVFLHARLKKLLVTVHPDKQAASGWEPKLLRETGLIMSERATLPRLWTCCLWIAACRHAKGLCASLACNCCGDPKTLELCACPASAQECSRLTPAYQRQGLAASTLEHFVFPSHPHLPALRNLELFLDETGIAAYR